MTIKPGDKVRVVGQDKEYHVQGVSVAGTYLIGDDTWVPESWLRIVASETCVAQWNEWDCGVDAAGNAWVRINGGALKVEGPRSLKVYETNDLILGEIKSFKNRKLYFYYELRNK